MSKRDELENRIAYLNNLGKLGGLIGELHQHRLQLDDIDRRRANIASLQARSVYSDDDLSGPIKRLEQDFNAIMSKVNLVKAQIIEVFNTDITDGKTRDKAIKILQDRWLKSKDLETLDKILDRIMKQKSSQRS